MSRRFRDRDMFPYKPPTYRSVTFHGPYQGRDNKFHSKGFVKPNQGFNNRFNQNIGSINNRIPSSQFQGSNNIPQNPGRQNFQSSSSAPSPVNRPYKESRWDKQSPRTSPNDTKNHFQSTVKQTPNSVGQSHNSVRSSSISPSDQSWRSARPSQEQSQVQKQELPQMSAHKQAQTPTITIQLKTPVDQKSSTPNNQSVKTKTNITAHLQKYFGTINGNIAQNTPSNKDKNGHAANTAKTNNTAHLQKYFGTINGNSAQDTPSNKDKSGHAANTTKTNNTAHLQCYFTPSSKDKNGHAANTTLGENNNNKSEKLKLKNWNELSANTTSGQTYSPATSTPIKNPRKNKANKSQEKNQEVTTIIKMSSSERIKHLSSPPPQPSTSHDNMPHSSQNKKIHSPPMTTKTIKLESEYQQPSTSEEVVYRQQTQSPDSNSNQPTTTHTLKEEEDTEPEISGFPVPLHELLTCYNCKRWISKDEVRACLCAISCVNCTVNTPHCYGCNTALTSDERLSRFYLRISRSMPHSCPYEGCTKIMDAHEDHEATCEHRPLECPVCNLNISKSLVIEHFKDQHPLQVPLCENENNNVVSGKFWSQDESTNIGKILCFLNEQFLQITLNKFEVEEQKDAQFVLEKLPNSDINYNLKLVFKKGSWNCTFACKKASRLYCIIEVPVDVVSEWIDRKCKLDILITMKRKINRNTNSAKKAKLTQNE